MENICVLAGPKALTRLLWVVLGCSGFQATELLVTCAPPSGPSKTRVWPVGTCLMEPVLSRPRSGPHSCSLTTSPGDYTLHGAALLSSSLLQSPCFPGAPVFGQESKGFTYCAMPVRVPRASAGRTEEDGRALCRAAAPPSARRSPASGFGLGWEGAEEGYLKWIFLHAL